MTEFSILWEKKAISLELYLTNPNSKSLQLKMAGCHLITSHYARRGSKGLWLPERGGRHEPDDFYLAIGQVVYTLKGREAFICIKSHTKHILRRNSTGKQAAAKDQISQTSITDDFSVLDCSLVHYFFSSFLCLCSLINLISRSPRNQAQDAGAAVNHN